MVPGKRKHQPPRLSTQEEIEERIQQDCECEGINCFKNVSVEVLRAVRNATEQMSRSEREIFVAGKLDALARRGEVSHHTRAGERATGRARVTYDYQLDSTQVCRTVFLYAHDVSSFTLKCIQNRLDAGIFVPAEHAGKGRTAWNAASADEVGEVTAFIRNYATIHGLPQPAAPRGHNKPAPTYLPCVTTKKAVHAKYTEAGRHSCLLYVWQVVAERVL